MSEEQPLQLPEGLSDEEIAAAAVVAVLARHKAPAPAPKPSHGKDPWTESTLPGRKPTWQHPT